MIVRHRLRGALTTLAIVALASAACSRAPVPPHLAGLARTKVWLGRQAAQMIAGMHGKGVAPSSSVVAQYGRQGELRVFLSRYADGAEASRVLARMLDRIAANGAGFTKPRQDESATGRWLTVGPGGHHALWVSDATLYWLQTDPLLLDRALAELPAPTTANWT